MILGDPIEVKSFLSVLKKVLSGQDVEKLTLSALQPLSNKQVLTRLMPPAGQDNNFFLMRLLYN